MTEKEANGKWCALVGGRHEEAHCCASRCMAWRWVPDKDGETMKQVGGEFFEVGYCGLVGKPRGVA